jgi:hypothetical protein
MICIKIINERWTRLKKEGKGPKRKITEVLQKALKISKEQPFSI